MAAKRGHEVDEKSAKKLRLTAEGDGDERLRRFVDWCKEQSLEISDKVRVSREGSCAQYGMVATEDIAEGECLFEIPRALLLTPDNTHIKHLLQEDNESLKSSSGWVPTLISLMYEYTTPSSRWRPYMDLVPDFNELDLPMFWAKEDMSRELGGTGVAEAVKRDLGFIDKEFNNIVLPFLHKHSNVFSERCRDIEFYKRMVAFVMAYSFTEPEKNDEEDSDSDEEEEDLQPRKGPMMVPMADILNHVAKNNAHLDFGKDSLQMIATARITKGEEVYNTYGQLANWQLLHMYGFCEPHTDNHYDAVEIPTKILHDIICSDETADNLRFVKEKWEYLDNMGVVSDDGAFVLGVDGIITEEELITALKVIVMDKVGFLEQQEKEGWSDDEDADHKDYSLSFESIPNVPVSWKVLLKRLAESCMSRYDTNLEKEEQTIQNPDVWSSLSPRRRHCVYIRHGQLNLLHQLIRACS